MVLAPVTFGTKTIDELTLILLSHIQLWTIDY